MNISGQSVTPRETPDISRINSMHSCEVCSELCQQERSDGMSTVLLTTSIKSFLLLCQSVRILWETSKALKGPVLFLFPFFTCKQLQARKLISHPQVYILLQTAEEKAQETQDMPKLTNSELLDLKNYGLFIFVSNPEAITITIS